MLHGTGRSLLGSDKNYINKVLGIQSANLIGGWPFNEPSGLRAHCVVTQTFTGDIAYNGDMEIAGHGGAITAAGWYQRAGGGTIAAEAVVIHGGARAVKLTEGASTWIYQNMVVKPGESYVYSFWTQGDGANAGRYGIKNQSDNAWFVALNTSTGVAGGAYAQVTDTIVIPATCSEIIVYLEAPAGGGNFCYYDDFTLTGTVDFGAAYCRPGVTLGGGGIGDGKTSAAFDAANTYVAVQGALFNSLYDPDLGSAISWGKMSAAQWADAAAFRYLVHPKSSTDAFVYVVFGKHTEAKTLFWRRKTAEADSDNEQKYVFDTVPTGWFCMGFSWDTTTPRLKGYLYAPGVVAWHKVFDIAGEDMDSLAAYSWTGLNTMLAAGGGNSQLWQGWLGPIAQWGGVTLTEVETSTLVFTLTE